MLTYEITHELAQPFDDVEFLAGATGGGKALAMPYIESRQVMARLDRVVGPENWEFTWEPLNDRGTVIKGLLRVYNTVKTDVGEASEQGESYKSCVSDALKRTAVHFGIGRYLYLLPAKWADYDPQKKRFTSQPAYSSQEIARAVDRALDRVPDAGSRYPRQNTPRSVQQASMQAQAPPSSNGSSDKDIALQNAAALRWHGDHLLVQFGRILGQPPLQRGAKPTPEDYARLAAATGECLRLMPLCKAAAVANHGEGMGDHFYLADFTDRCGTPFEAYADLGYSHWVTLAKSYGIE